MSCTYTVGAIAIIPDSKVLDSEGYPAEYSNDSVDPVEKPIYVMRFFVFWAINFSCAPTSK